MTIRPVPLQTTTEEQAFPGCLRREYEVRCEACGRFMSSIVLVIYFDSKKMTLSDHLAAAGIQIQAGALGRCLRCREENAQILFLS